MADRADKKPALPRTSTSSSAASRAGKRRVELASPSPDGGKGAKKGGPTTSPRPWYRRAGFWFLVIVVEALGALVISQVAPSNVNVSLEGGDPALFCAQVERLRALNPSQAEGSTDLVGLKNGYADELDILLKLASAAPVDLQPDMDRLAKSTKELGDEVTTIQDHKRNDPAWPGAIPQIIAKQEEVNVRTKKEIDRFHEVSVRQCGIDLTIPVETTTTVPVPPATDPEGPPGSVLPQPTGTAPLAPATTTSSPAGTTTPLP